MKKITLFLSVALGALNIQAQNDYTLTTTTGQTYTELTGATSVNNGQPWDWDYYGEFNLPFSFSFAGEAVNRFLFDDDYFAFVAPGADYDTDIDGVYLAYPTSFFIQDRTYSNGTSTTPISYKTEGTVPNRILKLEIKNAGAESASYLGFEEDEFYMNFQIWLYEGTNVIEFRYGTNNVSQELINAYLEDGGLNVVALFGPVKGYVISGNAANATYGEYTEETFPGNINLTAFPASGTVYKLTPAATAGGPAFNANTFSLYPNPATTVLNIRAADATDAHYAIYNIMGTLVAEGSLTGIDTAINTANLQDGVYVLNIGGTHHKFIKK
jgi:hypothetical protein